MTKKINVHPEWKTLQTLTNGAKRKLHLVNGLQMGCKKKTNDESGTPRSQSGWKTSWDKKDDKEDQCASRVSGWKTSWDKKDDKEDQCASRVEDSSNTNQWGKKEAGSSPPSSGKWAAKRKLMMRVGPLVLSLDGKLLGPRRMTKKINVHPEWKTLQTLTNGAKRKLDHLLLHLSGWKTSWDKKDDKEDQCASRVVDSSNTNQWGKKEAGSLLLHLVNGLRWKTNDESGTPRSQSGWKTSWAKKDDKEDQCASRVVDSSNTNQWGKKEARSSPPSSGKWAAVEN
ncbi:hypothetical protein Tco_0052978 [Tanacetum coccineum]